MKHRHPGTVLFEDRAARKPPVRVDVGEVPEGLRFLRTAKGEAPVLRVVRRGSGDHVSISEYGPGGEVLRRTLGSTRAPR